VCRLAAYFEPIYRVQESMPLNSGAVDTRTV